VLCNYRPMGVERLWPTLIHWDHVYWGGGALFAATGGYLSSLALMYCPR
jgi:equilibrative nucleoside transporter 1/2/3